MPRSGTSASLLAVQVGSPNCNRPALRKTVAPTTTKTNTTHTNTKPNKSQSISNSVHLGGAIDLGGLQQPLQTTGYCGHIFGVSRSAKGQLLPAPLTNEAAWAEDVGQKGSKCRARQLHALAKTPRRPTAQATWALTASYSAQGCVIPGRMLLGSSAFLSLNLDSMLTTQFESQGVFFIQNFF